MPASYAAVQEDLRRNAAVTPKYNPETGKPLEQYKMSAGQRLGRIFQDLATGGVGGVLRGVADRNDPGYYGPGAVNNRWVRDEATRQGRMAADTAQIGSYEGEQAQKQKEFADLNKQYEDEIKKRYETDEDTIRQERAAEQERHNTEVEDLKRKLQEATTPQGKAQTEFEARKYVAYKIGLKGDDRKMYLANGKLPDDQLKAKELAIREKELGLKQSEHDEKVRETNEFGLTANEQRGVNAIAPGVMAHIQDLNKQRTLSLAAGMDTTKLDADIAAQTKVFNDAVQQVRSGRRPAPGGSKRAPTIDKTRPSLPSVKAKSGKVYKLGDPVTVSGQGKFITYIDSKGNVETGDQPPK
jgi:hypothetical protein